VRSALLAGLLAGCASPDLASLTQRFAAGDVGGVREAFARLAVEEGGDAHLWLLNRAAADLAAGDPRAGIAALRTARDRLDELRTSYAGWIEAVLTDDRALVYDGADYEHVLVRAYLALLDLACGEGDAEAYLLQMLQRQAELRDAFTVEEGETPPSIAPRSAAIGNWLLAAVAADDPTRAGDVERQLRTVIEHEPDCGIARDELARYARAGLCAPGHGVLQVVALVGLGPYRVARDEPVSSVILDLAHRIYNARRDRVAVPVNLIKEVQIADLALRQDNPDAVHVAVGGLGAVTQTVTSVDRLAEAEFARLRPRMVIRAVVRRIFKLAAAEVAKAQTTAAAGEAGEEGKRIRRPGQRETDAERRQREEAEKRERERKQREQLGSALWDLVALAWIAFEDADTRCWALLPATFQVARFELPEGVHEVALRAGAAGNPMGREQKTQVRVHAGRTTFVIAQVPSRDGGPPPVTSRPADVAAP
jgi:hypothetical protein